MRDDHAVLLSALVLLLGACWAVDLNPLAQEVMAYQAGYATPHINSLAALSVLFH